MLDISKLKYLFESENELENNLIVNKNELDELTGVDNELLQKNENILFNIKKVNKHSQEAFFYDRITELKELETQDNSDLLDNIVNYFGTYTYAQKMYVILEDLSDYITLSERYVGQEIPNQIQKKIIKTVLLLHRYGIYHKSLSGLLSKNTRNILINEQNKIKITNLDNSCYIYKDIDVYNETGEYCYKNNDDEMNYKRITDKHFMTNKRNNCNQLDVHGNTVNKIKCLQENDLIMLENIGFSVENIISSIEEMGVRHLYEYKKPDDFITYSPNPIKKNVSHVSVVPLKLGRVYSSTKRINSFRYGGKRSRKNIHKSNRKR